MRKSYPPLQKRTPRRKIREDVVLILKNNPHPLTAEKILAKLKKKKPTLNKTTIYRALDTMLKNGKIREIQFSERKKRYEIENTPHHHHLVCTSCEAVENINMVADLIQEEKKIQKKTGFDIQKHTLEFFGICTNCQPKHS